MNGPLPPSPEYTMADIERALFSFSPEISSSDNSVVSKSTVDNHHNPNHLFLPNEKPVSNMSNDNLFVDPNLCSIRPIHRHPPSLPVVTTTVPHCGYGRIIIGGYSYQSHHIVHPSRMVVPSSFSLPQQPQSLFFNPNTSTYQPSMTVTNITPVSTRKISYQPHQLTINNKKRLLNQTNLFQSVNKKQIVSSTITRPSQTSKKVAFYRPKSVDSPAVCLETLPKATVNILPPKTSLFFTVTSRVSKAYHDIFIGTPIEHSAEQLPSGNWIYQRMYTSYRTVVIFKQFIIDLIKEQIKMENCLKKEEELRFNWLDVIVLRSCYYSIPRNRNEAPVVPKVCKIWFEPHGSELIEIQLEVDKKFTTISPVLKSLSNFYRVVERLNMDQVELSLISAWLLFGDPDDGKESSESKKFRCMCRSFMSGLLSEHHSTLASKGKFRTMDIEFSLSEVAGAATYISLSDSC